MGRMFPKRVDIMFVYFLLGLIFFCGFVVEAVFFMVVPWNYIPSITLILVICLGFMFGEVRGALIGLAVGFVADVLFVSPELGYFSLSKMLMGIGAGLSGKEIYHEKTIAPVMLVFAGTLIHEIFVYLLLFLFTGENILNLPLEFAITGLFLPRAFINALLAIPLYSLVWWLMQKRGKSRLKVL